jgi:hypothetical protein
LADKRNRRAAEEMRENAAASIDNRMRLQVSKRYIILYGAPECELTMSAQIRRILLRELGQWLW